jgi:UDP-N-acetylmuramate dehydrogenase
MTSHHNYSIRELSYYRTGGSCQRFFAPESLDELKLALREIAENKWPVFIIGAGTNSLIMDEPWSGAALSLHRMAAVEVRGNIVYAQAGARNAQLVAAALQYELAGVAWMHRLPGQLGATVRMNARCYGGEISQVVSAVCSVDWQGREYRYENDTESKTIFRGYKDTIFMDNQQLITAIEVSLRPGSRDEILAKMNACEQDRVSKQQFVYPSCGCVFKNDYSPEVAVSSGLLLEMVGAKELSLGDAQVSPAHANFIFNRGNARSEDILRLSLQMRERVWQHFGVWLAYEMEIHGVIPEELREKVLEQRTPQYRKENLAQAKAAFR